MDVAQPAVPELRSPASGLRTQGREQTLARFEGTTAAPSNGLSQSRLNPRAISEAVPGIGWEVFVLALCIDAQAELV